MVSASDIGAAEDLLGRGRNLLVLGEWEEARHCLEEAVERDPSPEALEELGMAASLCEDGAATFDARERAFQGYHEQDKSTAAARIALLLVFDYLEFRGSPAIANGWLQRARRLLQDVALCFEHGLLAYTEGYIASEVRNDVVAARKLGAQVVSVADEIGNVDLEMLGRALEGYARVTIGQLTRGMNLLDESTAIAVGGEAKDINAIGYACCHMICACEQVRDYDRAAQWCQRVKELCKKWRLKSFFAYCRTRYASILIYRGKWDEAEQELTAAETELAEYRPGLVAESTIHLAELRRQQGRLDEALRLFEQVSFHVDSLLGRGAVALDQGDAVTAAEFAGRFLRQHTPATKTERVAGLDVLIQAHLALGNIEKAQKLLEELDGIANLINTDQLRALTRQLRGLLAYTANEQDAAQHHLSDAADLYERIDNPYKAGQARLQLARVLRAIDRHERAESEAREALRICRRLGATKEVEKAEAFLNGGIKSDSSSLNDRGSDLAPSFTDREEEILGHLVSGMSNQEIADTLFVSVRTVERHLSNVYQKIGVSGKSARAAAVAHALKNGVA